MKTRPPYAEDAICGNYCCRHPLSHHVEGTRNPWPWLGPEWPTDCGASVGDGECACGRFAPAVYVRPILDYSPQASGLSRTIWETFFVSWLGRHYWCDALGRWVITTDEDRRRVSNLADEYNRTYNVDIKVAFDETPKKEFTK